MAHIGFDIDGVLADFVNAFLPWYNSRHQTAFVETDVWTHELWRVFGVDRTYLNQEISTFACSPSENTIQPYPGMPAIIRRLAQEHSLSQVTARFTPDALQGTRVFTNLHYPGCLGALHMSYDPQHNPYGDKGLICQQRGIVLLVEDQANYVCDAVDYGVQAILINRPWNTRKEVPNCVPRIDIPELEKVIPQLLNGRH